jgi:hypothetical protein
MPAFAGLTGDRVSPKAVRDTGLASSIEMPAKLVDGSALRGLLEADFWVETAHAAKAAKRKGG